MRFHAAGPAIPDELLIARDEGRVVFFCGAGVSRAKALLPDFFGLAEAVISALGVPQANSANRLLREARDIESRVGERGIISADRIFGVLERDFSVRDIHAAVANALRPRANADLEAHRALLRLATGPDNRIRLVTTNFDRLFEQCNGALKTWQPPRLAELRRFDELDGIVHLHGRVNSDYSDSDDKTFVLSSSEFGRAYLSEAWATDFIQSVLDKYVVVFVGYTADDPPVQYLLEALCRDSIAIREVYAFQSELGGDAKGKWAHKGVEAISYSETDNHFALWQTLESWSERASDVEGWYRGVMDIARTRPSELLPHLRGQVAHVASSPKGAQIFASVGEEPPGAEWVCVFDPQVRFSTPRPEYDDGHNANFVDPFSLYGLDSDPVPKALAPDDHYSKREVPKDAWDAFARNRWDEKELSNEAASAFRGPRSSLGSRLPTRLSHLASWLSRVAGEPAAPWWVSAQRGLHPEVRREIESQLLRGELHASPEVREAWGYLFETWDDVGSDFDFSIFDLKRSIERGGWNPATARAYGRIYRPRLSCERPYNRPRPVIASRTLRRSEIVLVDVKYPERHGAPEVPPGHLRAVVRYLRGNLESAAFLENQLGGYGLTNLVPIEVDPNIQGEPSSREFGISVLFLKYVDLFKRLVECDPSAAKEETQAWATDDESIFARLRLWACGLDITSGLHAAQVINSLRDEVFWASQHQRDLLLVLKRRWEALPDVQRSDLERRLIAGPPAWESETPTEHAERRTSSALDRLHWLRLNGCRLASETDSQMDLLQQENTTWQEQRAGTAALSHEGTSGWVGTNKEYASLLTVPLDRVLILAKELSGRERNLFVENDPFAGLAADLPVRTLRALSRASKSQIYPMWAWKTFLNEGRHQERPRLAMAVAARLSRLPPDEIGQLVFPISDWLLKCGGTLLARFPMQFARVWNVVLGQLRTAPAIGRSAIVRGTQEPEWGTEALNAPVGKLAQALMKDPRIAELKEGSKLPQEWKDWADEVLSLKGDLSLHALVIFAYALNWFYFVDRDWARTRIVVAMQGRDQRSTAAWAGFLWAAKPPSPQLFPDVKTALLNAATDVRSEKRGHVDVLAGITLAAWVNYLISDEEMRDVTLRSTEGFRLQVIWQLGQWTDIDQSKKTHLLAHVWPRQVTIKTPRLSARLVEFAFSSTPETFLEIANAVLSLVTKADGEYLRIHDLGDSALLSQFPEISLDLLFATLPDARSMWPYDIEKVFSKLVEGNIALDSDPRLMELRRRWRS